MGGSAGVYKGHSDRAAAARPLGPRLVARSSPDWYFSRAASNPSDQRRLPTTAPQIRQNTSLPIRAAPPRAAHTPKHKPQGHTAKGPSAAAKNHTERAPRGRKPPRNRGASRPPPSVAALRVDAQQRHVRHRTLAPQSPRGRCDSDRSMARKTRAEAKLRLAKLGARCLPTRAYGCKRDFHSSYSFLATSRARLARGLRTPRAPKQVSACRACRAALSA